jgi:hypothetical protein
VRKHDPAGEAGNKHAAAARERVRREADPAGIPDRPGDLERRASHVRDLPVHSEGEIVALLRADLCSHEQRDTGVPSLPAVAARAERVVVGQKHQVNARGGGRRDELVHSRGSVRVGRMEVEDA